MSIEARQIQETLYSYAAILNFTPSPQGLRAKFGACSVQNAQLLLWHIVSMRFDHLRVASDPGAGHPFIASDSLIRLHICIQSCTKHCTIQCSTAVAISAEIVVKQVA